jgi:hypothetical protein
LILRMWKIAQLSSQGENTLKEGQDCYHIVLFFKGTMLELQPYVIMKGLHTFLHIMVKQT